jgi:Anti-sigma-K factor rskA/Putative zinc-finger
VDRELTHDAVQELLGVYALDAVDPDEAELIARHLLDCPRCRAEVADHREVSALLAYSGAPAPPELWERIVASLEEPPPALVLAPVSQLPAGAERNRFGTRGRVVSLRPAAVAFAVAAASIIGLGVEVVRLDRRTSPSVALPAVVKSAMGDPSARVVNLRSASGNQTVDAVLLPNGQGYITQANLAKLPAGRTYQLWGLLDGRLISVGVLGPNPGLAAFRADGTVTELAITDEMVPGVIATQQTPVVAGLVKL